MKFTKPLVCVVELTKDELVGILKLIRSTNQPDRADAGLTKEESDAVNALYMEHCDLFGV